MESKHDHQIYTSLYNILGTNKMFSSQHHIVLDQGILIFFFLWQQTLKVLFLKQNF